MNWDGPVSRLPLRFLWIAVAASLVAALAALIAVARAEGEWPAFPAYPANLDFGPVFEGELLEQTIAAPATPLREFRLFAVPPWPAKVTVRVRDAGQASNDLLYESQTPIGASGSIRVRIPGTVDTSRRILRVQVVNPAGSSTPLTLRASRINPYPDGQAAARDDVGEGNVDLVMETRRRVTPGSLAQEVWRAHAPGAVFILLTVSVVGGAVLGWLRRRTAGRPLPVSISAGLLLLTAGLLAARIGFAWLAPWTA